MRRIDEGDTWWWVMRDPAGNAFCLIAAQGADRSL
ncbi:VOC family protein [Allosaccharopolyspora coralli]|nr:VOC family protein [Allosaccharopolyspora coralli]